MKKTLTVMVLIVMILALTLTGVKAASSATLANDLYSKLSAYGITAGDKVKIERYVSEHNVTDAQAESVLAKADEVVATMQAEGKTNVKDLSQAGKDAVIASAKAAASAMGLTLTVGSNGTYTLTDNNGKVVDVVKVTSDGKLAYTGNNINVAVVVSSVAVIALAAAVIAKKSFKVEA